MSFRLGLHLVLAVLWLSAAIYVFLSPRFDAWGSQRYSAGILAAALMFWNLFRVWLAWREQRTRYADDERSTPVDY